MDNGPPDLSRGRRCIGTLQAVFQSHASAVRVAVNGNACIFVLEAALDGGHIAFADLNHIDGPDKQMIWSENVADKRGRTQGADKPDQDLPRRAIKIVLPPA